MIPVFSVTSPEQCLGPTDNMRRGVAREGELFQNVHRMLQALLDQQRCLGRALDALPLPSTPAPDLLCLRANSLALAASLEQSTRLLKDMQVRAIGTDCGVYSHVLTPTCRWSTSRTRTTRVALRRSQRRRNRRNPCCDPRRIFLSPLALLIFCDVLLTLNLRILTSNMNRKHVRILVIKWNNCVPLKLTQNVSCIEKHVSLLFLYEQ